MFGVAVPADRRLSELRRQDLRTRETLEEQVRTSERRLVWQPARRPPPSVNIEPQRRIGEGSVPRGERDTRTLISQAERPDSTTQTVIRPDTTERLPSDVQAANIVTVPKPARKFVAPSLRVSETRQEARPVVEAPEELLSAAGTNGQGESEIEQLGRVRRGAKPVRQFAGIGNAPASRKGFAVAVEAPEDLAGSATGVAGGGDSEIESLGRVSRGAKPVRKFEGMPTSAGTRRGTGSGSAALDAPEGVAELAVVGLNPGGAVVVPEGVRSGAFARAPVAGPPASGDPSGTEGIKAPNLLARSSPSLGGIVPVPAAAVPERKILKELSAPPISRTLSAPLRPSARIVPPLVDTMFAGRNVYTLVVPDPKVAGYSGDWVIWFGPQNQAEGRVTAPYPAQKLVPETEAPPPEGRVAFVQFAAVIGANGKLSKVKILRSRAEDGAQKRALLDLQTWNFRPATLNGLPIEVDAVLEISFLF